MLRLELDPKVERKAQLHQWLQQIPPASLKYHNDRLKTKNTVLKNTVIHNSENTE